MVRSLVGAGYGCTVLNMMPSTEITYAGDRLKALPILDPIPLLTLSVGYHKSDTRRIVGHFAERCSSYFKDNPRANIVRV